MNKINTFFSELYQQTLKIYEKIDIITQIWHRAKFYFKCINGPWDLIHSKQYEENPASHHSEKHKDRHTDKLTDGLMDWTLSYILQFRLGGVGNNNMWRKEICAF